MRKKRGPNGYSLFTKAYMRKFKADPRCTTEKFKSVSTAWKAIGTIPQRQAVSRKIMAAYNGTSSAYKFNNHF